MRRWLIIVFVLLLPWRLWASDAMALAVLHSAPAPAHGPVQAALADPAAALCGHSGLALHEGSHSGSDAHAHAHALALALAAAHSVAHGSSSSDHHSQMHSVSAQALADNSACPGHAAEEGAHGLCLLCGICHQALAAPLRLGAMQTVLPSSEPVPAPSVIAQAERQPELKPPIF